MRTKWADFPDLLPLWIAVYIDILGYSLLLPFMPFFMEEYNSTPLVIGLLLATNAFFGFFSGPILGKWSDQYGRKPILLICQLGSLSAFLMLAFSTSLWMLFLSRVVDGIFGGIYPITKAVIGDIVPPQQRSKQMTNLGLGHTLASLLGPGIGGLLAPWGIIAPGLFASGLTILAFVLTLTSFHESNPIVLARIQSTSISNHPVNLSQTLTKNIPVLESREIALENVKPIWKDAQVRFLIIQWLFHTLAFSIYMGMISMFAYLQFGVDEERISVILMIGGAVRLIIRLFFFMPVLDHLGEKKTAILGLLIFVVVFFLLSFVTNEVQFILILIAVSFAASCARGVLNSFLSRSVHPKDQGKALGVSTSLDNFAQIVGPIIGGYFLGSLEIIWYGMLLMGLSIVPLLMSSKTLEFQWENQKKTKQMLLNEDAD